MMLRSSSTPLLGSLPSSISPDSPSHHHDTATLHPHKFSFHHHMPPPGSHRFTNLSCSSSPASSSFGNGGMRRAQSEGNLESLTSSSTRLHGSLLESIPSFSYHNSEFKSNDDEFTDDEKQEEVDDEGFGKSCGFNAQNKVARLNKLIGIGVDGGFGCGGSGATGTGGGGGRNLSQASHGGGGGGRNDVEAHYRKMVNENPGNPLFLGNYAQFLYQKQDLKGAEEYYSRAILADPNDGEILAQYGKLLWEVHRDKDRATSCFERAVDAASEDR